ncbi:MAG: hypothetical protein J6D03_09965 [Clostridia bacterium]|nr:hypothetical protein [Clostridia bacterium]
MEKKENIQIENPIKNNRYVNDITFATRLSSFIHYVGRKYGAMDFMIDEEWEYLLDVANKLVRYQRATVCGEDQDYFDNLDRNTVINNR